MKIGQDSVAVILATQEVEIRKIVVQNQPQQIIHKTLPRKETPHQKMAGGVAQGEGPEVKFSTEKKKRMNIEFLNLLKPP
jgi:hypothetical protein